MKALEFIWLCILVALGISGWGYAWHLSTLCRGQQDPRSILNDFGNSFTVPADRGPILIPTDRPYTVCFEVPQGAYTIPYCAPPRTFVDAWISYPYTLREQEYRRTHPSPAYERWWKEQVERDEKERKTP